MINILRCLSTGPLQISHTRKNLYKTFLCEGKETLYLLLTSHKTEVTLVLVQTVYYRVCQDLAVNHPKTGYEDNLQRVNFRCLCVSYVLKCPLQSAKLLNCLNVGSQSHLKWLKEWSLIFFFFFYGVLQLVETLEHILPTHVYLFINYVHVLLYLHIYVFTYIR